MSSWSKVGIERLWQSIFKLVQWLEQNGWAGYDPYDIKGMSLFLYLQRLGLQAPSPLRMIRKTLFALEGHYPMLMRQLLGVKKQINAKAMGLFAKAYLNLYVAAREERFKDGAIECLKWLLANPAPGYSGLCWGYPFHWQSKALIPKGTPSAVVTSVVGDAFWIAYQVLGEKHYLDACKSICQFFVNNLNIDKIDDVRICFSYTPIDNFHVHNANLLVAEFLIRLGKEIGNRDYVDMALKAIDYTLSEQNTDGSIYYWARIQNHYSPNHIDHYHSGFEIRALYGIWKATKEPKYKQALVRYYSFYRTNLLKEENGLIIPKMTPLSLYPINIHSCAETILCNATLADEFKEARSLLPGLCDWIITNMQTEQGWFIYLIEKAHGREQRVQMPYIRWGQAWMLLALSACFRLHKSIIENMESR